VNCIYLSSVRPELVEGLLFCSSAAMSFWTYMLHCAGGAFYVGHTDDLDRRIAEHEDGLMPGFTHDRLPVKLLWAEYFPQRIDALEMERRIKGWSRAKKMALIRGDWDQIIALASSKNRASTGSARTEER
jgi:putative endonuclease